MTLALRQRFESVLNRPDYSDRVKALFDARYAGREELEALLPANFWKPIEAFGNPPLAKDMNPWHERQNARLVISLISVALAKNPRLDRMRLERHAAKEGQLVEACDELIGFYKSKGIYP